jgi:hypothetical protein
MKHAKFSYLAIAGILIVAEPSVELNSHAKIYGGATLYQNSLSATYQSLLGDTRPSNWTHDHREPQPKVPSTISEIAATGALVSEDDQFPLYLTIANRTSKVR